MSTLPPPSRRVLTELRADRFVSVDRRGVGTTAVARAWFQLDAALEAHAAALAALDRLEAAVVAAHGYPRVPLPTPPGDAPDYAADATTIDRRVSDRAMARRLKAALRRRQRDFTAAAFAAGLTSAQRREADTAHDVGDAIATLLLAPAATRADLALKLVVLIAAGEAGPDEAATFPWVHLRLILADIGDGQARCA